jgi:hypothetical protein
VGSLMRTIFTISLAFAAGFGVQSALRSQRVTWEPRQNNTRANGLLHRIITGVPPDRMGR